MGFPSTRSLIVLTIVFSLAIWPLFPTELPRENFHEVVGPIPEWNPAIQASGEGPEGPSTFSPFTPSLGFTENMGQVGKGGGRYYTEGHPLSVAFGNGWMSYWWRGERVGLGGVLIRVDFEDANDVEPRGIDQIDRYKNYLIGSDPGGWRTGVRTFEKVLYEGLWDNIDLRFFFSGAGLKYELVVHQGGDPADITFSVEGHDEISIISDDTMVISRGTVDITDDGLKAYYDEDHGEAVEVGFQTRGDDLWGFDLGSFDPTRVVVIDPLIYSTRIDGDRGERSEAVAVDEEGHAYVTGRTYSKNFPITPGVVKKTLDDAYDAFVTKLSPDGRSIVYSTYLGGEGLEIGYCLDIDEEGNVFVGGWTNSKDFPTTPGAFQRQRDVGTSDAFVSKLNSNGSLFLYSTLIAGDHVDSVSLINVDDDGYAYLAGGTSSGNFPTTSGAYMVPYRRDRSHTFLSRLSPDGSSLDPSTIVTGNPSYGSAGWINGIEVDDEGGVFLCGETGSSTFPTTQDAFQPEYGERGDHAFIMKMNANFSAIEYSTFLVSGGNNDAKDIVLASDGMVYVCGETWRTRFPTTPGAYQTEPMGFDGYVCKLDITNSSLVFSTLIRGSGRDRIKDISVEPDGRVHVAGYTNSTDITQSPEYSKARGGTRWSGESNDIFVCTLSVDGSEVLYSTYFGGPDDEGFGGMGVDGKGNIVVAGTVGSGFITTPGAFCNTINSYSVFVVKVVPTLPVAQPLVLADGPILYAGYRAYEFKVDANPCRTGAIPSTTRLYLDIGDGYIVVSWSYVDSPLQFKVEHDLDDLVTLSSRMGDVIEDEANGTAILTFKLLLDWSWPHEELCHAFVETVAPLDQTAFYMSRDLFWVENDLEFEGNLSIRGEWQGELEPGDWVRKGEAVTAYGPLVVYQNTTVIFPPEGSFNLTLYDNDGDTVVVTQRPGEVLDATIIADDRNDLHEMMTLTILDLPRNATLLGDLNVTLRVDGDPPVFRNTLHDGQVWHNGSRVMVWIIADDSVTSGINASSIMYSLATDGRSSFPGYWTKEGLETEADGPTVKAWVTLNLPEGSDNYIRWTVVDLVGNGPTVSSDLQIKVDATPPIFFDPTPSGDSWANSLRVEHTITISDPDGSGVDARSIQYRVLLDNITNNGGWQDLDVTGRVHLGNYTARVTLELSETMNYTIQWRARDGVGNGFATSLHYWIRVDMTPISFDGFLPPENEIQNKRVVNCSIAVGSGLSESPLDPESLQFRWGRDDVANPKWRSIMAEGWMVQDRIGVVIEMEVDGSDHWVQFRGSDVAGNGPTTTLRYQVQVDATGPIFNRFTPRPDQKQDDGTVEVSVEISDGFAGIDLWSVRLRFRTEGEDTMGDWISIYIEGDSELLKGYALLELAPGTENIVQFIATDKVGNEALSKDFKVWVNRPPEAVISSPQDGERINPYAPVILSSVGTRDPDNELLTIAWTVDGMDDTLGNNPELTIYLEPGHHTIVLTVRDQSGSEDSATVRFTVEEIPPETHVNEPQEPVILLLFLTIIASLAVAYGFHRARGRGHEGQE